MTMVSHSISHSAKNAHSHYLAWRSTSSWMSIHPDAARTPEKRRVTARNTCSVPPASTRYRLMATSATLLTIRQAQERLGVSRSTMYRLIEAGDLQRLYVRTSPRIAEPSLVRYVSRQEHLGDAGKVVL